ncbi:MAG: TIGR04168 family protein [Planctomycetota bacterium]
MSSIPRPFRILFIGDVHGHWTDLDTAFLEQGDQDLTVFVGDLGDEDVDIVRRIAAIDSELYVMLGNHDAWQSFVDRRATKVLHEILDLLGEDHIAYSRRELPGAGLTLIGARPFSWGGRDLRSPELYRELYGVESHEESAERIVDLVSRAQHEDLLMVAHNGPFGLSRRPGDIWGKDFGRPGGDWGDRDLRLALDALANQRVHVRAVVAGHMHDRLLFPKGAARRRFLRHDGVDFVNPAVVPRIRRDPEWGELHHFLSTDWQSGSLVDVREIWVDGEMVVRKTVRPEFHVEQENNGEAV